MKNDINVRKKSVDQLISSLPSDVILVAAAKTRTLDEVKAIIDCGIRHVGWNYVQEALPIIQEIGDEVEWHMIGHLQRNKAKYVAQYFDMMETIDSWRIAKYLDQQCERYDKTMPVLVEINSGEESNKTGVNPTEIDDLIRKMSKLRHLKVMGLMTMGPRFGDPEKSRPYFKLTRAAFERIASFNLPNITMRYLSMGMSNSYQIAIEEGANIVRIGTKLFGERS